MDSALLLAYNRSQPPNWAKRSSMTTEPSSSHPPTSLARGYLLVLLAASLWATLGIIYTYLASSMACRPWP